MPTDNPCPVPICQSKAAPGQLMCRPCWYRVPPRLKSKVGATWRAWCSDVGNVEKATAYRIASQDAIDHAAMR